MITSKVDFLKKVLSQLDLKKAAVLDAGTGRTSAQLLIETNPKSLVCVTLKGDLRKGKKVEEILNSTHNKRYTLIYGDLANENLFPGSSFDFILADYLVGELAVDKVLDVLTNLFRFLKPGGLLFLADRQFYPPFVPKFEYLSMGKIKTELGLERRSNRDLVEIIDLFLRISKELLSFSPMLRSFDFPLDWVRIWMKEAGFTLCETVEFKSKVNTREEFYSRLRWAKERIKNLKSQKLQEGLDQELKKVIQEFNRRQIPDSDFFLRQQFLIKAIRPPKATSHFNERHP